LTLNKAIMQKGFAGTIAFICSFLALMSIGIFGVLIFKMYLLEQNIKENFLVEVVLAKKISKEDTQSILKNITSSNYCLAAVAISKEEAMTSLKKEMGEDVADFLDENPLYNSIQFTLKSPYVTSYSLNLIGSQLKKNEKVEAVRFSDLSLLNLEKTLPIIRLIAVITVSIITFFALLVVFFITRLKLTFDAPKIATLKLFGASKWFIAKPHIGTSFLSAFFASILALLAIFGIGFYINTLYPQLQIEADFIKFGIYTTVLIVFSLLFIPLSTGIALIPYLKYK
jgi:cell division transport system permease protein